MNDMHFISFEKHVQIMVYNNNKNFRLFKIRYIFVTNIVFSRKYFESYIQYIIQCCILFKLILLKTYAYLFDINSDFNNSSIFFFIIYSMNL